MLTEKTVTRLVPHAPTLGAGIPLDTSPSSYISPAKKTKFELCTSPLQKSTAQNSSPFCPNI